MSALLPWGIALGWAVVVAVVVLRVVTHFGPRIARAPGVRVVTGVSARRARRRRGGEETNDLPVVVDLIGMALAAGCPPALAFDLAVPWAPAPIRAALTPVVRRHGSFAAALTAAGAGDPSVRRVADALLVSERTGAPVGPALTRLADQLRAETRRRAEGRARSVPIRLLFPLVFLVLPAFVLLTVVPAISVAFTR